MTGEEVTEGGRKRLYVSDLDGTLLGNDARLSARSRAILEDLLRDGLLFTVASARSVVAIQSILAGLTLPLPVIEFNGAFLSDLATGRHHVVHDHRATKDQALATLVERAGLADAEVVAFGDSDNDVPLFRAAHRAFAVANASPELRVLATGVIGRAEEDCVAVFIETERRTENAGQRVADGQEA